MLQAAAAHSLGSNRGLVAEQLVRHKVRAIRIARGGIRDLHKLLDKTWEALPAGPYRRDDDQRHCRANRRTRWRPKSFPSTVFPPLPL